MKTLKLMKHTLLAAALVGATLLTGCGNNSHPANTTVMTVLTALHDKQYEVVKKLTTKDLDDNAKHKKSVVSFVRSLSDIDFKDIKIEKTTVDGQKASVEISAKFYPNFVFTVKNQDGKWLIDDINEVNEFETPDAEVSTPKVSAADALIKKIWTASDEELNGMQLELVNKITSFSSRDQDRILKALQQRVAEDLKKLSEDNQ